MYRPGTPAELAPTPAWGGLYEATALALVPFVRVAMLVPEGSMRTALEVVAALAPSGVLPLRIRVNRIGIELQGRRDGGRRQATVAGAARGAGPGRGRPHRG